MGRDPVDAAAKDATTTAHGGIAVQSSIVDCQGCPLWVRDSATVRRGEAVCADRAHGEISSDRAVVDGQASTYRLDAAPIGGCAANGEGSIAVEGAAVD